jgi:hypothetical protein
LTRRIHATRRRDRDAKPLAVSINGGGACLSLRRRRTVVRRYGITSVVALAELLAVFGSVVVEDTDAVFVIVVFFDGGVTLIVTVTVDPLPIVPRLQVTILFVGCVKLQFPWVAVAEPNAVFLGSWSLTETLAAASGPLLCTVSV